MSRLQNGSRPLRIVTGERNGDFMEEISACLRKHAESIDDTASRCNDPQIVMELQFISAEIRQDADKIDGK